MILDTENTSNPDSIVDSGPCRIFDIGSMYAKSLVQGHAACFRAWRQKTRRMRDAGILVPKEAFIGGGTVLKLGAQKLDKHRDPMVSGIPPLSWAVICWTPILQRAFNTIRTRVVGP